MLGRYLSIVLLFNSTISSLLETRIVSPFNLTTVIVQGCGQTLELGLVDKNRTVVNY